MLGAVCTECNDFQCSCLNQTNTLIYNTSAKSELPRKPYIKNKTPLDKVKTYLNDESSIIQPANIAPLTINSFKSVSQTKHQAPMTNNQIHTSQIQKDSRFGLIKKGLRFGNLNICHIIPKMDEIKLLLQNRQSLDILGFCKYELVLIILPDISCKGHFITYKNTGIIFFIDVPYISSIIPSVLLDL